MMNTSKSSLLAKFAGIVGVAIFAVAPALAQHPGATVHGHVSNPAGQPLTTGTVKFTQDESVPYKDAKISNTAPLDGSGNYKVTDVVPGTYFVYVVQGDKILDRQELKVKPTDTDLTLDDDMSRAEYVKGMTPEQQKELEEYKKKNAAVVDANKVISQLNATLKTVRADLAAAAPDKGDVSKDMASMKEAVGVKPNVGLLWLTYGDTMLAQGRHMAAEDKAQGKVASTDTAVTQMYSDAVDAYKKAVALDSAETKPSVSSLAADYNQLGNALTAEGKTDDATAAFDNAAKTDPSKAGMYYKNAAAVLYNAGQMDGALDAANKAIAADPNSADAYFIKGQALVTKSTVDPKTNKLTAPEGCIEAYQKFLQIAPNDPKVPQVKAVLASLGQSIDTSYRAHKH
ncbi:MAG: tetratricopeptide repeat protein [Acidobacteriaceae bacterium]